MDEMKQKAFEVVTKAVAELAEDMGFPALANPVESTPLFGGDDGIDSLSLVRLVADIEREAETRARQDSRAGGRTGDVAAAKSLPHGRHAKRAAVRAPRRGRMTEVVLITGTRKGIGRYLVDHYLAKGCVVAGCSRDPFEGPVPENYHHYIADVADERAMVEMIAGRATALWRGHGADQQCRHRCDEPPAC